MSKISRTKKGLRATWHLVCGRTDKYRQLVYEMATERLGHKINQLMDEKEPSKLVNTHHMDHLGTWKVGCFFNSVADILHNEPELASKLLEPIQEKLREHNVAVFAYLQRYTESGGILGSPARIIVCLKATETKIPEKVPVQTIVC